MKQDNLEKYIASNRNEFDSDEVSALVWLNLQKELDLKEGSAKLPLLKRVRTMRVLQIAAMFIVVLGVGLLIGVEITKNNAAINPQIQEFVEAEKHFSKEVDHMWTAVKANGLEEESNIEEDLNALDAVYNELKNELLQNPNANTEVAVNAMLNNYKAKIEILETVLSKYKSNNNQQINLENDKVEI